MAGYPKSVAPSVGSAYVAISADGSGKGPASQGPGSSVSDPHTGTAPVPLGTPIGGLNSDPILVDNAPQFVATPLDPHAGKWPGIPEESQGKEAYGWPDGDKIPRGYTRPPGTHTGYWQTETNEMGHYGQSQVTDDAGWKISPESPDGRVHNVEKNGQDVNWGGWWTSPEDNYSPPHLPIGGSQSFDGVTAQYGGLHDSGGNSAYVPPPEPEPDTTPDSPSPDFSSLWSI